MSKINEEMMKWIKCSERLPEDFQKVLFLNKLKGTFAGIFAKRKDINSSDGWLYNCDNTCAYCWQNAYHNDEILYWMPLPKPPED